jgi:CRP/FNR family transcriptional regulator
VADPLYLFACAIRWQRHREAEGGWELVHSARFGRACEREVAQAMLGGLDPVCSVRIRSWIAGLGGTNLIDAARSGSSGENAEEKEMNTPYGLEIVENCQKCSLKHEGYFCNLSPLVLKAFNGISHQTTFPGGATLFVEGQASRGVFLLCSGKVKLSTSSRDGKVLILKMATAGDILGLSAVASGQSYEVTAETAVPCQVNFVQREALLALLERFGEAGLRSAQALSREFQSAYRDIHDLILARSSAGKLAKLLLSWTPAADTGAKEIRVRYALTHEEMAQMIGASRETVTRLLSDLRKKQLIRLEGSTLVIRNRMALEALVS